MRSVVRPTKSGGGGFNRAVCGVIGIAMTALIPGFARGQDKRADREATSEERPAAELVREGNRRLSSGDLTAALELYQRALPAASDSHELAFNLGLAHLKLGDFAAAREELSKALQSEDARLVNDALYALGVCDHAEALGGGELEGKERLELAQNAIRRYHDVLRADPKHAGARDAWNKAAAFWQRLKSEEQPPPQQEQSGEGGEEKQESEPEDGDQPQAPSPSAGGDGSDENAQPQAQPDGESSQDANEGGQPSSQQESQERQGEAVEDQQQPSDDGKEQRAHGEEQGERSEVSGSEEKAEDSLEQAARELRRIIDRQRINEKRRPQPGIKPGAPAGGKDW